MISLPFLLFSALLSLFAFFAVDSYLQIFIYIGIIAFVSLSPLATRRLNNLSAFLLLFGLIYTIRPIYILKENDWFILQSLVNRMDLVSAMAFGSFASVIGLLMICIGYQLARLKWPLKLNSTLENSNSSYQFSRPTNICCIGLLAFQVLSLLYILSIKGESATSIYSSDAGAYAYLLPQVIQSAEIIVLVIFFKNVSPKNTFVNLYSVISLFLFLLYTTSMKDVSMFRGFYLTGAIAAFISVLHVMKDRVKPWILYIPIIFFLPAFRAMGSARHLSSSDTLEYVSEILKSFSLEQWWSFFDNLGDMNVYDTFISAIHSMPRFHPFLLAWVYPPLQFIPRNWWPGKPQFGMLVDMSFTQGWPYHPGLIGFYYLDGGFIWMLLSCFLTGLLLFALDRWLFGMPSGYIKSSLYGIVVINSLYAARGYFHFQVIQYLYMIAPVYFIYWFLLRFKFLREPKKRLGLSLSVNTR